MATTLNLEQLADRLEPSLRRAFLQAVQAIRGRIDISAIARMLENGDVAGALRVVGLDPADFSNLAVVHTDIFNRGGLAAAQSIPPIPQTAGYAVRVVWNARWPAAEQWARNWSSTFITELIDDQRTSIRDFLSRGLADGLNPRTVALDLVGRIDAATKLRTGGIIGLHSTQEQWLRNYTAALESDLRAALTYGLRDKRFDAAILKAIQDDTGLPADLRARMIAAYSNRALKWRADSIARTETMRALSAAQTQAYQQAIDKGQLDASLITRFPVTAGDERVRPTHRAVPAMNKEGRKWNEPFATPFGPQMHAPYSGEIQCRCHERIKIDFLDKVVRENG